MSADVVPPLTSIASSPVPEVESGPVLGLGRGIGWTYVQLGSTAGASLITAGMILRQLGAADFGVFALLVAAAAFVKTLGLSLGRSMVRAAARQHTAVGNEQENARAELSTAHSVCAVIGGGAVMLLSSFGLALPSIVGYSGGHRTAVLATGVLMSLSLGASLATSTLIGLASGRRDFRAIALPAAAAAATSIGLVALLVRPLGLVSLGIAEFAGTVVASGMLIRWARRNAPWFSLRPRRVAPLDARRVIWAALPLILLSVGGQVIATTDLFILGLSFGPAVVGFYRVGSMLPTQAVGVLYQGYDVVLPVLAGTNDRAVQERTVAFMTRVSCYIGGVVLAAIAFLRDDVVLLFNGGPSSVASSVLLVFCGIWMTTLVAHGIGLLLIARGRQRRFVWPALFEVVANAVATVVLIKVMGVIGAAVATLIVLGITHTLILPFIARDEMSNSGRLLVIDGWLTVGVGIVVAGLAFVPLRAMAPSLTRLLLGAGGAGLLGVLTGAVVLRADGRRELSSLLRREPIAAA